LGEACSETDKCASGLVCGHVDDTNALEWICQPDCTENPRTDCIDLPGGFPTDRCIECTADTCYGIEDRAVSYCQFKRPQESDDATVEPQVPQESDDATVEPQETDDATVEPQVPQESDDAIVEPQESDDATVEPQETDGGVTVPQQEIILV